MAASIREQSVAAFIKNIQMVVAYPVVRSPHDPVAKDASQMCVVDWVKQVSEPLTGQLSNNALMVRVGLLTRSQQAEQDSDAELVIIHKAIMADRELGGLSQDISLAGANKERDDAECVISHQYHVEFRNQQGDISQ